MIFAAIERNGEARAVVVPSAAAAFLDPLMFRWFDRDSILCTDKLATDDWFGTKMRRQHRVLHSAREFAKTERGTRVHVNTVENFFGLFKRGIFGIHHWVKHLHRYVDEHTFRQNRRSDDTADRIARYLIPGVVAASSCATCCHARARHAGGKRQAPAGGRGQVRPPWWPSPPSVEPLHGAQ